MPEQTVWKAAAAKCQKLARDSLNPEWLLSEDRLPAAEQLSVIDFVQTCGLLTPRELAITDDSAVHLVSRMAAGELTAVETVTAFLKRAHVAHQVTNFATEFMVKSALDTAAELDQYFKATGKIKGPLHGLPISVKEHIGIKGLMCHSTYATWVDNIAEDDALIVKCVKSAGAIVHVRTNQPQTLLSFDCVNNLNGRTRNPHNRTLTPGGSSGGEGVSLSMRCAALGIGTDLGGSVRLPAAFCGSFGLRTTALRNPLGGILLAGTGNEGLRCVASPLANSADDLALFQKAVLDQEPWEVETSLVPVPWREAKPYLPQDITIGVIWEDGVVHPHPPVTKALRHTVDRLKAAGVKVVDYTPTGYAELGSVGLKLIAADGFATQKGLLAKANEPWLPATKATLDTYTIEPPSPPEIWEIIVQRDAARDEMHQRLKSLGIDFLLGPVFPGAAPTEGIGRYAGYTIVYNILDMPALTIPTGLKVDKNIDVVEKDYAPTNPVDEMEYSLYSPEKYLDAPIALQVVGKHMRDEETVAVSHLISEIISAEAQ